MVADQQVTTRVIRVLLVMFAAQVFIAPTTMNLALVPDAVWSGQWWRLGTYALVHGGLLHVGFNLLGLHILARPVEVVAGPELVVRVLLLGALAGGVFALALNPQTVTLGASGAVMAAAGALFMFERSAGTPVGSSFGFQIVAINLVLPLLVPGISFAGHLGGALAGVWVARRHLAEQHT
jgi:rhomboid protease GluP